MKQLITFLSSSLSKILVAPVYFAVVVLYFGFFIGFYAYAVSQFSYIYDLVQQLLNDLSIDSIGLDPGIKEVVSSMMYSLGITTTLNTFIPFFVTSLHIWAIVFILKFALYLYKRFLSQLLDIKKVIEW